MHVFKNINITSISSLYFIITLIYLIISLFYWEFSWKSQFYMYTLEHDTIKTDGLNLNEPFFICCLHTTDCSATVVICKARVYHYNNRKPLKKTRQYITKKKFIWENPFETYFVFTSRRLTEWRPNNCNCVGECNKTALSI